MWGAGLLLLWLSRLPCVPVELGLIPVPVPAPPAPVAAAPPSPAPAPPPALPAPLAMRETARYRVHYGLLGSVGELQLSIADEVRDGAARLVRMGGTGEGSIFGFGRMRTRVQSEFDPALLGSRRWISARWKGDQAVTDTIDQPQPGSITLRRRRGEDPFEQTQQVRVLPPILDPVAFIARVRLAPPPAGRPQTLQVLEGRALWRVTLATAGVRELPDGRSGATALRIDGRAEPIFFDGRIDRDRPQRSFALWLTEDATRVPLRLSMPLGPGEVVVELVELLRQPRPPSPTPALPSS
jgi:hypothetical protein